jgi:hypothetical protein
MILKRQTASKAAEQIRALKWMSGNWFGTCETKQCELIWGHPFNNVIQGTYTTFESGKALSTGRLQISLQDKHVIFSMKPLELDLFPLAGIVEPATFQLVEIDDHRAVFRADYEEPFSTLEIQRIGDSLTSNFKEASRIAEGSDQFQFNLVKG